MNNKITNIKPNDEKNNLEQVILFDDNLLAETKFKDDNSVEVRFNGDNNLSLFKQYAICNRDKDGVYSKQIFENRARFVLNNIYSNFIYIFRLYINNLKLNDIDTDKYSYYIDDCARNTSYLYTREYLYSDINNGNDNKDNHPIQYSMEYINNFTDSIIMRNYTDFFSSILTDISLKNNIIISYFVKDMNDYFCMLRDNLLIAFAQLENEKNILY